MRAKPFAGSGPELQATARFLVNRISVVIPRTECDQDCRSVTVSVDCDSVRRRGQRGADVPTGKEARTVLRVVLLSMTACRWTISSRLTQFLAGGNDW
jgi:hypothetical protein